VGLSINGYRDAHLRCSTVFGLCGQQSIPERHCRCGSRPKLPTLPAHEALKAEEKASSLGEAFLFAGSA
jgi:hypothetical protein